MSRKLGPMLRRLRRSQKITLRELARRAKVPPGYLSELEHGTKRNPGLDTIRKLARALGVKASVLLDE